MTLDFCLWGWEVRIAQHSSPGLTDGISATRFPFVEDICVDPGVRPQSNRFPPTADSNST